MKTSPGERPIKGMVSDESSSWWETNKGYISDESISLQDTYIGSKRPLVGETSVEHPSDQKIPLVERTMSNKKRTIGENIWPKCTCILRERERQVSKKGLLGERPVSGWNGPLRGNQCQTNADFQRRHQERRQSDQKGSCGERPMSCQKGSLLRWLYSRLDHAYLVLTLVWHVCLPFLTPATAVSRIYQLDS